MKFNGSDTDNYGACLQVAAAICACVGPIMFATYFALTYLRKKNV